MKTITINGRNFELIKPRNTQTPFRGWFCDENAIFYHYERPSQYKISIWRDWLKWARECDGVHAFEITSANCMQFSITGSYIDENDVQYVLRITKDHNRAYVVG